MPFDVPTIIAADNAGNDTDHDAWVKARDLIRAANAGQLQGFKNKLINGAFDVWQRGTSFANPANSELFTADRWRAARDAAFANTFSRQAGFLGAQYCMRVQRNSGETTTGNLRLVQTFESIESVALAGKTIIVSADVRVGANYSGGGQLGFAWVSGTGVDQGSTGLAWTGVQTGFSFAGVSTTAARVQWSPFTLPSNATQCGFHIFHPTSGTAGAADFFEITNVQVEVVDATTPKSSAFERRPVGLELALCQRYYQKSFAPNTAPADAVYESPISAFSRAATDRFSVVLNRPFVVPMRVTPTLTFYNPAASSADKIRDEGGGANRAVGDTYISAAGFMIGNLAAAVTTTASSPHSVHFAASAEL